MKKPSLRFRQVFEHPTHFKVTKPLGNPLVIAKKGLSPSLMGRLRKYAEGTPDEPVQPPTNQELQTALALRDEGVGVERIKAKPWSITPPVEYITETEPTSYANVDDVAPVAEPAPSPFPSPVAIPEVAPKIVAAPAAKPVESKSVPDLEIPEPQSAAPVAVTPTTAPAAAPAATPVVVVQTAQPAPTEPPRPTAEEVRQQRIDAYMKAFEDQEAKRIADQAAVATKAAEINAEAQESARQAMMRAKDAYAGRERALGEFDAPKEMTGTDIARSIGSALSVAMGAFASGMTGMPNFALKIYEDALARDLAKQRQQRDSILKQMEIAGLSVDEAEKMYRAQKDKEFATRLSLAASATTSPKAREEAMKAAVQFAQKAAVDEADIEKKKAEGFRAQKQGELAGVQAGVVQPEFELKVTEQQRKIEKDRMDALNALADRALKEKLSGNELRAEIYGINKRFEAAKAAIEAKGKPKEEMPEFGAAIPPFLKGAEPKEVRKYFIQYDAPVRDASGEITTQRQGGFLLDPKQKRDFLERSAGFDIVRRQAEELKQWGKEHPTGLLGLVATGNPAEALREKDRLEALVKTMVEGYIKNVTGIKRASSAAIKYMEGVNRNPSDISQIFSLMTGGSESRFNEVLNEVSGAQNAMHQKYLYGGAPTLEPTKEQKYGAKYE